MSIRARAVRRLSKEDVMKFNKTLGIIQGLLAILFLFAGGMKLVIGGAVAPALFPLVVGLLLASIGYGRWQRETETWAS
jgi:hypothetical protein